MSDIPSFPYRLLWEERQVVSVANLTRRDAVDFLAVAPKAGVTTTTVRYPLDQANAALDICVAQDCRARRYCARKPLNPTGGRGSRFPAEGDPERSLENETVVKRRVNSPLARLRCSWTVMAMDASVASPRTDRRGRPASDLVQP
jgi:hypothetical protein